MHLPSNHKLQNNKYRIQNKIGQGGFGITYRALWTMTAQGAMGAIDTEIPIVIKEFFWKDYCAREEGSSSVSISSATGKDMFTRFKEKLKKEAVILSRLDHPNIVRVLDVFEENNTAYMAMQLVEGESLKDKIARLGKLDEATALKYTQQLCSALAEVHGKRILHLDLKPGNVIIDKNDNAQLLDFGISKQYDDKHQETSTTPVGISKGYAPLEQYSGIETFNPPTDVYALGATLYTMLTGKVPLEATQLGVRDQELIHNFNANVSDRVVAAIEKAMEIKPAKRFQTVLEFSAALDDKEVVITTTPDKTPNKPHINVDDKTLIETPPSSQQSSIPQQQITAPSSDRDVARNISAKNKPKNRKPLWITLGAVVFVAMVLFVFYKIGTKAEKAIYYDYFETIYGVTGEIEFIDMYFVEGGTFTMGCTSEQDNDCDENEEPAHQVTLSDFYMGKYPVTQAQWKAVMGNNPSYFEGDDLPVEQVSWEEVQEFIEKLNEMTGKNYRLPTEAEWEYAARGGNRSNGYKYSGSNTIDDVAWYEDNSEVKTHSVGTKQANELYIYDMSGNVWEWCSDWYGTYSSSAQTNSKGPDTGSFRVARGGSWGNEAQHCRASIRGYTTPDDSQRILGFRLVLVQ